MVKGVGKRHKVLALCLTSSTLKKLIKMLLSNPVILPISMFAVLSSRSLTRPSMLVACIG